MTYLIALVVAILIGALIALLSFTNMGKNFGEKSVEAEAQRVVSQAHSLEAAIIAFENIYGTVELVENPVEFDIDGVTPLPTTYNFEPLVNKGLLKQDFSSELAQAGFSWEVTEGSEAGTVNIQAKMSSEESCQWANHIKSQKPITDPVPECGTPAADGYICCVKP